MTTQQPQKRRGKRKTTKEMQRVYLRRRIVVGVVALALLALIGFGIYKLATSVFATYHDHGGAAASNSSVSGHHKKAASSKKSDNSNNQDKANQSSVKKCGAKDVKLELTPVSQSVGVGGTLDFKATIRYEGGDSCLVDASNASRILTISNVSGSESSSDAGADSGDGKTKSGQGNGVVWSSAVCPADPRNLLMAKGDKDVQKITWPADSTGSTCVPDEQLPRVERGTYLAQLRLKDHPGVKSEKVPITVE
ncbi:hypothetical protein [Bifidobacterium sp. ESL0800]|uniref:hypothetical protein n=1 Tax=Bifidobacterium sp. ESL0800 TaxID=2983236 RepID=UPI0023F61BA4|nr:hypothetical protein [Bifidobacterium sp. ESL0800]WEV75663.1 hypothetical protein OZX75_00125 [Bifidobacterium sp. ESL0800]